MYKFMLFTPQLIYVDLIRDDDVSVPSSSPRVHFITSELLEQVEMNGKKRSRDGSPKFESLLVIGVNCIHYFTWYIYELQVW